MWSVVSVLCGFYVVCFVCFIWILCGLLCLFYVDFMWSATKYTESFKQSTRLFCPILKKFQICQQILMKVTNIKFHGNPSSGTGADIYIYIYICLHKDTTPPQPNHTVTPTHIEPEQYNTGNKSIISRKLLKMDVLTFETC